MLLCEFLEAATVVKTLITLLAPRETNHTDLNRMHMPEPLSLVKKGIGYGGHFGS